VQKEAEVEVKTDVVVVMTDAEIESKTKSLMEEYLHLHDIAVRSVFHLNTL